MSQEIDPTAGLLLGVTIALLAGGIVIGLIVKINDFIHKLDYINLEIGRTVGAEQKYWKRKKRRLWLSLLPFYRK